MFGENSFTHCGAKEEAICLGIIVQYPKYVIRPRSDENLAVNVEKRIQPFPPVADYGGCAGAGFKKPNTR